MKKPLLLKVYVNWIVYVGSDINARETLNKQYKK